MNDRQIDNQRENETHSVRIRREKKTSAKKDKGVGEEKRWNIVERMRKTWNKKGAIQQSFPLKHPRDM